MRKTEETLMYLSIMPFSFKESNKWIYSKKTILMSNIISNSMIKMLMIRVRAAIWITSRIIKNAKIWFKILLKLRKNSFWEFNNWNY